MISSEPNVEFKTMCFMKNRMMIPAFAMMLFFTVSCGNSSSKEEKLAAGDYYTCTMHPEIKQDKPGDCPKCGMKLVLKSSISADSTKMQMPADSMKMPADSMKMSM